MTRDELMERLRGLSVQERHLALDYAFVYFDSELIMAALNYATAIRGAEEYVNPSH